MPSPPKSVDVRFRSAQEVLSAIDRTVARIAKRRREAEAADLKADELYKQGINAALAGTLRDTAEARRKRAQMIEQIYLPRLKNKLAEIQTLLLPGVGFTDISIKQ